MLEPSNTSRGWPAMTSYKIQDGGRLQYDFWKSKIRNNSAADSPSSPNFAQYRNGRKLGEFFDKYCKNIKIQDGGQWQWCQQLNMNCIFLVPAHPD